MMRRDVAQGAFQRADFDRTVIGNDLILSAGTRIVTRNDANRIDGQAEPVAGINARTLPLLFSNSLAMDAGSVLIRKWSAGFSPLHATNTLKVEAA